MPQRISDSDLSMMAADISPDDIVLDLRDARAELRDVREALRQMSLSNKIAVEALEREKDHCCCYTGGYNVADDTCSNPNCTMMHIRTALDQIKGITDATTNN